jgi:hypothetical protein
MDLRFQTLPAILLKIVLRLLPSKLHAAMQITATRAAINPYSIAVTPASSIINCKTVPRIFILLLLELRRCPWSGEELDESLITGRVDTRRRNTFEFGCSSAVAESAAVQVVFALIHRILRSGEAVPSASCLKTR